MLGLLAPTTIAIGASLALGGSLRELLRSGLRGWPALLAAFAVELVLYNPPVDRQGWAMHIGPWIWLATKLVMLGVLIWNAVPSPGRVTWPWTLAALGVGLNALVIALNDGHMPQSEAASVAVWGASHLDASRLQNVALMGPQTRLPWLGDVVPEPAWLPRANVVSVGDILLALGVACWAFVKAAPSTRLRSRTLISFLGTTINGAAPPSRGRAG
jgi:hypothetical protein